MRPRVSARRARKIKIRANRRAKCNDWSYSVRRATFAKISDNRALLSTIKVRARTKGRKNKSGRYVRRTGKYRNRATAGDYEERRRVALTVSEPAEPVIG